jgi:hypothetical protein
MGKVTSALMGNHSLMLGLYYEKESGRQGEEENKKKQKQEKKS